LKRDSNSLDVADDRPLKRKRLMAINDDDMDWFKGEVSDIKVCIREIAEHLRGDVDVKLDELLASDICLESVLFQINLASQIYSCY
jgi:hypothetical protein